MKFFKESIFAVRFSNCPSHLAHSLAAATVKCQNIKSKSCLTLTRRISRSRLPVTAGGIGGFDGKEGWSTAPAKGGTSKSQTAQLSSQHNFLLVCISDSILLLHTPIPVIQGRLRPTEYIIALSKFWVYDRCWWLFALTMHCQSMCIAAQVLNRKI